MAPLAVSMRVERMSSHTNTQSDKKENRLVARVSPAVHEIIQRAASYSGATLSQFMVTSALEKARETIEQTETLQLSMEGADKLTSAMANPPPVTPKLKKAAQHYRDTVNVRTD